MKLVILERLVVYYYVIKKIIFGEHCFSGPYSNFFWDCKNLIIIVSIVAIVIFIFIFYITLQENKELLKENKETVQKRRKKQKDKIMKKTFSDHSFGFAAKYKCSSKT